MLVFSFFYYLLELLWIPPKAIWHIFVSIRQSKPNKYVILTLYSFRKIAVGVQPTRQKALQYMFHVNLTNSKHKNITPKEIRS